MTLPTGDDLLAQLEQIRPPFDQTTVLEPLNRLLLVVTNLESENYLLSRVHPNQEVRRRAEDEVRRAQQLRTRMTPSPACSCRSR
jgi:hypothetical protein